MSLIPAQTTPCEEEAKLVEELKKACSGFRVQDSPANFQPRTGAILAALAPCDHGSPEAASSSLLENVTALHHPALPDSQIRQTKPAHRRLRC